MVIMHVKTNWFLELISSIYIERELFVISVSGKHNQEDDCPVNLTTMSLKKLLIYVTDLKVKTISYQSGRVKTVHFFVQGTPNQQTLGYARIGMRNMQL